MVPENIHTSPIEKPFTGWIWIFSGTTHWFIVFLVSVVIVLLSFVAVKTLGLVL